MGMVMKPHKHCELIKAWADGKQIEIKYDGIWTDWVFSESPRWLEKQEYRIKPEPKPDVVIETWIQPSSKNQIYVFQNVTDKNIKFTFDGETGELKSSEVLK